MRFFILSGLCATLLACQSKPKKTELPAEVDYLKSKDASVVLSQGHNESAVFSLDGEKIYYISKNRNGHRNTQIHEYNLTMQRDRRITFQDGEVLQAFPLEKDQLLYSSTTDEVKEQPFVVDADPRYPRAEIYLRDSFGNEIQRLTESPGYDGDMIYVPGKKQILFTSTRQGTPGLYWLDPETRKVSVFQYDIARPQRNATLSADNKHLFWIEEDLLRGTQHIITSTVFGKNRTVVLSLDGVIHHVVQSPKNELVYSWTPKGADFRQIDTRDSAKLCTRTLLKNKLHFSEMQFSVKNPNLMLFRVASTEKSHIYRWELPTDLGPCNEQVASDTLKK